MFQKIPQNPLPSSFCSKTIPCGVQMPDLKEKLSKYFIGTFDLYEKLFSIIKEHRSFYSKPQPLRHPLVFYYGHTAAFFVNKFLDKGLINCRINEANERMFAVGVDEMDWDDLNEAHYDWPSIPDVRKYREKVKKMVLNVIQNTSETMIKWQSDMWIVLMGIQHERIHLETSAVIIRRLPVEDVDCPEWFQQCPHMQKDLYRIPKNSIKTVPPFQKQWDRQISTTKTYGWDNEFGIKKINVKEFKASRMLVSNGEYLEFVRDKGYQTFEYWSQEGQMWLKCTKTKKPLFWQIKYLNAQDQSYFLRTMTKIIQMPWDWPVEVNNLQSQAFCNWKSKKTGKKLRLPTEDEYFALRNLLSTDLNDWEQKSVGNINLEYWFSPNPVDMFNIQDFYDIVGNVWQHTITPIYPFQNFEIHPIYEDFTTPTFDNRHNIIKGGSFISTGNEALYHSRYAFRRHFYQFAGFRYVESQNQTEVISAEIDQSDQSVEIALKNHFTEKDSYIEKVLEYIKEKKVLLNQKIQKSLVVGCSVGRLPLEFAKIVKQSYGIDYTARYFQMATRLLQQRKLTYRSVEIDIENLQIDNKILQKVYLYQMNPENTDIRKINNIDFMVIDGISIRPNTLEKGILDCLKLLHPVTLKNTVSIMVLRGDKNHLQHEKIQQVIQSEGKFKIYKSEQTQIINGSQQSDTKKVLSSFVVLKGL